MKIKIRKTSKKAIVPRRESEKSAGYDLYACIDKTIFIKPHETVMIGTGLSMELPDGTFGAIFPRSGIATKYGLAPANKVGVCDSDYRGEYMVALHNHSDKMQTVEPNQRIAQLIILPYIIADFCEVDELSTTKRDNRGFGSTGK